MSVKKKVKEADIKQDEGNKEGEGIPGANPAPKADGEGHDDAAKDKELIKAMLKKHLGDEANPEQEAHAYEAYEAYVAMGHKKEEAAEDAAKAMKLAKHMAAKKEVDEGAKKKENDDADDDESKKEGDMEAKESEILKLKGEIAALREKDAKDELDKYIDAKLADSKLPRSVTKSFRESMGDVKTREAFDRSYDVYMQGYKAAGAKSELGNIFVIGTERTNPAQGATNKKVDFSKLGK